MGFSQLYRYSYEGPVMTFDICVCKHWSAETMAASEKKARSNFTYQYKKQHGLTTGAKISLPGTIKIVE